MNLQLLSKTSRSMDEMCHEEEEDYQRCVGAKVRPPNHKHALI